MSHPRQAVPAKRHADGQPASQNRPPRLDGVLLRIVDGCLAGCIFVVPFLLGGRHPVGQLLLVGLASGGALAWTVEQSLREKRTWRWSTVELLLIAGVALLVLQITPLPEPLLKRLAPHSSEILPLWTAQEDSSVQLGVWSTVSLTPAATRAGLVLLLSYCLLFLVAVQRIRAVEDVERLLRWCALSAVLTALFGLVQFIIGNGKYFWFYEHPLTDTFDAPKAAFGNRNHFAHFLALGIGPLIWWLQDVSRRKGARRPAPFRRSAAELQGLELSATFRVLALGIVLFAVLLSLSRGGALVTCLAAAIAVAVCYRAGSAGLRLVGALAAVAALIGISLAIFGHDRVSDRLQPASLSSAQTPDETGARHTIWNATAKAVPDFLMLGSGAGSLRQVYPMYLPRRDTHQYYTHCENGYLQVALETGIAGLVLLIIGIGVCGFWCVAGLRAAPTGRILVCVGAVAAGLAASVVHSVFDFVWYNPACMAVVTILAGCACRLRQLAAERSGRRVRATRFPAAVGVAATVLLLAVGAWMVRSRIGPVMAQPHWVQFQLQNRAASDPRLFDELDGDGSDQAQQASLAAEERMKAELEKVVRWDPHHAAAHLQLAACYIKLFHGLQNSSINVMSLNQIRDAAIRSRFPSRAALDQWLARAVGDHYTYLDQALEHTRRALRLCPLNGEGYLYLGELCFLEGAQTPAKRAYVAQALKVRPFDGAVLFHAGKEAWLEGDYQQWLRYWQRSFQCGRIYQRQVIDWLAGRTRQEELGEEIRFFLDTFDPDLSALRYLHRRYRRIAQPEQMLALRRAYTQALEAEAETATSAEAADLWLEAMAVSIEASDPAGALRCAREAFSSAPHNFEVRRRFARCLAEHGQLAEAEEHLNWCLKRRPGDASLENMLRQVVKRQIERDGRTVRSSNSPHYRR